MCGRYTMTAHDPGALRMRFGLAETIALRERYNVAPGDDVVCVTTDRDGAPRGDVLRWGLVPHWADDPRTGYKMINARAETVRSKSAYRDALRTRRCLVVADGFYEWQRRDGERRKQPFWITRADGEPFAFAGLWAVWHGGGEGVEPLRSCTIVTTTAAASIADVHPRMPVMLRDAGEEQRWLDHATAPDDALSLLRPLDDISRRAVGAAVNDAHHDAPDCLDPAPDDDPPAEPTLF